ncbi:hypothetical protein [Spirosoma litoris]
MNRNHTLLSRLLLVCVALAALSCSSDDPIKELKLFFGSYAGTATNQNNSADKKAMSINITSESNPIAGTYVLAGATGKVSGSVLGKILDLTLKPDATGTTYTFSGTTNDDNSVVTGTLTGVESSTTVKYSVSLSQ